MYKKSLFFLQIISRMRSLPRFIGAGWRGMEVEARSVWIVFDLICMWFEIMRTKIQKKCKKLLLVFSSNNFPRFIGAGWRGMEVEARRGESTGNISATIAMSDLTWNSWNTKYKIVRDRFKMWWFSLSSVHFAWVLGPMTFNFLSKMM